jgi:hypothetical protein
MFLLSHHRHRYKDRVEGIVEFALIPSYLPVGLGRAKARPFFWFWALFFSLPELKPLFRLLFEKISATTAAVCSPAKGNRCDHSPKPYPQDPPKNRPLRFLQQFSPDKAKKPDLGRLAPLSQRRRLSYDARSLLI